MSIPVYVEGSVVGKLSGCWECIIVEEERKNLFPKSLMGTTMWDSGTRKRRDWLSSHLSCTWIIKFSLSTILLWSMS